MSHIVKAREVFDIELAAIKAVRAQLDATFDRTVETILAALKQRGKIVMQGTADDVRKNIEQIERAYLSGVVDEEHQEIQG